MSRLRQSWRLVECGLSALCLCAVLVLGACNDGNNPSPSPYPGRLDPVAGQWTAYGTGTGITGGLPNPFLIPAQSGGKTINYVYTGINNTLANGLTLKYDVTGPATFAPLPESSCGASGCGKALLRLFVWGKTADTTNDRWWCSSAKELIVGNDQSLQCSFNAAGWTGVNGQSAVGSQLFALSLVNPFSIGFTFGGMFAGHGVWTTSGSATFKVNSFTVQ